MVSRATWALIHKCDFPPTEDETFIRCPLRSTVRPFFHGCGIRPDSNAANPVTNGRKNQRLLVVRISRSFKCYSCCSSRNTMTSVNPPSQSNSFITSKEDKGFSNVERQFTWNNKQKHPCGSIHYDRDCPGVSNDSCCCCSECTPFFRYLGFHVPRCFFV